MPGLAATSQQRKGKTDPGEVAEEGKVEGRELRMMAMGYTT